MRDLGIEFPLRDEPTSVPTGDECEHAARGESCGRTDCHDCGREAAVMLREAVRCGTRGLLSMAREVARVQERYGCNIPDGAVTIVDLARARVADRWTSTGAERGRAFAWAEGVIDALCHNPGMQSGDYQDDISDQAAYMVGRLLVELHLVNEHLTKLEAQAMAGADITSAALAQPAEQPRPAQAVVTGRSGFESRAQHRIATLHAPVGETQRADETGVRARQR